VNKQLRSRRGAPRRVRHRLIDRGTPVSGRRGWRPWHLQRAISKQPPTFAPSSLYKLLKRSKRRAIDEYMSEESEGTESEGGGGTLSTMGDTLGDLVTGIPAPLRKNAAKAFTRLCTVAVEYPVALIEGAIAEKRAETQARVKLINASANQIARQMQTDPEFVRAAATKFAQKIIRERVNVDQVFENAAAELTSEPLAIASDKEPETPPISDDWLNAFENEAAQMSSDQMQRLFGKILAGEIRRPASYSIKTVKLVAQLDNQAATLFKRFCSLSISLCHPGTNTVFDARVVSMGNAGSNSLGAYGLAFDSLNILQEYGLIISDYNSWSDWRLAVVTTAKSSFLSTTRSVNGHLCRRVIHHRSTMHLMCMVSPFLGLVGSCCRS
jgi:Protein of unknown function (DUF2806)